MMVRGLPSPLRRAAGHAPLIVVHDDADFLLSVFAIVHESRT